ncbi:hypothetical protein B0T25DRAFT_76984 [Lasiosphaeria hispida]|uniref:Uncharacterized protein n=1 Tax=Lasiosphaeria hispida TaxID=260671 RepID=A0AAJ0HP87_9PEZI|nr:hypothetical protein B0T25DRAFT_76984 [Lasiosphaeria hispida]
MSHNALAHAAPETARDAAEGGEELAAPDAGTKPSSDGRGLQLLVETQTAAMADLLREMRETNRLLNVIATQASQTLGSQPIPVTSLSVDASSRGHEADDTKPLPRPPIDDKITASLQERAKHLTETCFQSACFLGHRRAINLREAFVQHVERQVVGDTLQYQIHLHTRTKTTVWVRVEGRVRSVPLIWWAYPSKLRRLPRSSTHFHRRDPGPEEGALPTLWATSVNSTWPLQPALECELGWSVPSPHPHTNFGNLRIAPASLDHYRTFIGLALCCGPAGRLFPAELTRTEPDKAYTLAGVGATADLLSPGSLW